MESFDDQIAGHHRKALDFMLDALGVQQCRDEAVHAAGVLRFEQQTPGLLVEHRRLRQRVAELEHELEAVVAELETVDRAIDARIDSDPERRLNDI